MAWIKQTDPENASGDLAAIYAQIAGARGAVGNILRIHSLSPPTMHAHVALYRELMFGPCELSRPEREMIAVAVSATNSCHY